MDANTIISLVSTIVAGLAFFFSIYTLRLQRKDVRPQLKIISPASIPRHIVDGESKNPLLIYLVSNVGQKPVYIFDLTLHAINDGLIAPLKLGKHKLPHRLEPGEIIEVNSNLDEDAEQLVRNAIENGNTDGFIVIRDGEWNAHVSEIFALNVDDESVISTEPFYAICPEHPEKPGFYTSISFRPKEPEANKVTVEVIISARVPFIRAAQQRHAPDRESAWM